MQSVLNAILDLLNFAQRKEVFIGVRNKKNDAAQGNGRDLGRELAKGDKSYLSSL